MTSNAIFLLTGFEAFGGSEVNPSILGCRNLEGKIVNGFKIVVEEVPLRYGEVRTAIEDHIENHKPAAIICTGQSSRAAIAIERVAINIGDARAPYNCGVQPVDELLNPGGPVAYFSRLPLRDILKAMKDAKIPVAISNSAGTFGCNQIFYHVMDHVARKELEIPAGFIHVPCLPEQVLDKQMPSMTLDLTTKALEIAVSTVTAGLE